VKFFFIPGASLMEIKPLGRDRVHVRCPGCGNERTYDLSDSGDRGFWHEEHCQTYDQIEEAQRLYDAAQRRH
jgi:hypothetical protein